MTVTTWDPSDDGGWTLSSDDLTATSPDNDTRGNIYVTYGAPAIPTDAKIYFEFTVYGAAIQTAFSVGFGEHNSDVSNKNEKAEGDIINPSSFVGYTYNGVISNNGNWIYDPQDNADWSAIHGANTAAPNLWADGSVIGVLLDRVDDTVQFTLNGVAQGGPFDISGIGNETIYPMAYSWFKSGPVATINGGAEGFAEPVPAGYTALDTLLSEGVPCFLSGTAIRAPGGEVPVERLAVGDVVVTASGAHKPLVWIGVGRALVTRGRRSAATPVIVRKGALADNVPYRDLRITKGHSLYLDRVLIPVEFLVNHRSILWDDNAQEVTVYHLELEEHDTILANGAPAESYRDDGNRWLFRNANSGWHLPPKQPCAAVATGGPVVDAVWWRLLDRARAPLKLPLTDDADLHLLVNGRRVDPVARHGSAHIFMVPGSSHSIRIASRAAIPAELAVARDPRPLGVALRQIVLRRGSRFHVIEANHPALTTGFHSYEPDNRYRWTHGDAALPAAMLADFAEQPFELVLHVGGTTRYINDGRKDLAA